MTRAVLIAGCGDVGTALGLMLTDRGHRVWGLRRNAATLPAAIEGIAADLGRPETLAGVPADVDTLVYVAAADAFDEVAYRRAYVEGLAAVTAALRRRGAPLARLLFASSTAVYGQCEGEWVDERSPTHPEGFSGRIMCEAEGLARGLADDVAIVRLGGIYGPGRTRLIDEVRSGRATVADGASEWTNRIHRDDAAGVLAHLITHAAPAGIWIGVDHEPALRADVLRWLADRLGVPAPSVEAPAPQGRRPRTNKRCSNRTLLASGYRFRYPTFREGYAAVLADG